MSKKTAALLTLLAVPVTYGILSAIKNPDRVAEAVANFGRKVRRKLWHLTQDIGDELYDSCDDDDWDDDDDDDFDYLDDDDDEPPYSSAYTKAHGDADHKLRIKDISIYDGNFEEAFTTYGKLLTDLMGTVKGTEALINIKLDVERAIAVINRDIPGMRASAACKRVQAARSVIDSMVRNELAMHFSRKHSLTEEFHGERVSCTWMTKWLLPEGAVVVLDDGNVDLIKNLPDIIGDPLTVGDINTYLVCTNAV